jgi:uncharacterized repeat protein (TIGR01451 family)
MWLLGTRARVTGSSRSLILIVVAALLMNGCLPRDASPPRASGQPPDVSPIPPSGQYKMDSGRWPLSFVENRGQLDSHIGYAVPSRDATTYFTAAGLTYAIQPGSGFHPTWKASDTTTTTRWILAADFVGANPDSAPVGQDLTEATFNYFRGSEDEWITAVPTYRGVSYADIWPGIDAFYGQRDGHLEYDLTLQPGADPTWIAIAYRGASSARITEDGSVEIVAGSSRLVEGAPYAYQDIAGQRVEVPAHFTLDEDAQLGQYTLGFQLGEYDRSQPLVIDPAVVIYGGFIGGERNDEGQGIAVDAAGSAYVVGQTNALMMGDTIPFPAMVGPDLTLDGNSDIFVAKVKPDGSGLVYAGYIGGDQGDGGQTITGGMGIAVDASGAAYVTGRAASSQAQGFPISATAFDKTFSGQEAFIAKVTPDGTKLAYCTFVGGDGNDEGYAIDIDSAGNAYITGLTEDGTNFPISGGAAQTTHGGGRDGFVVKVNQNGSALVYGTFVGANASEEGRGIAVDASGSAYVVGSTDSVPFQFHPTVGPNLENNGGIEAYVGKLNPAGTGWAYLGYVGGANDDEAIAVAVDKTCATACPAYVVGGTSSNPTTDLFPARGGPSLTFSGGMKDGFIAKVKGDGTGLVYAGYIGGPKSDISRAVAIDSTGAAYVATETHAASTSEFPFLNAPTFAPGGGNGDAAITKVKPDGSGFSYSGMFGGDNMIDLPFGIAVDALGSAYVVGETGSGTGFPTRIGPSTTFVGGPMNLDTFVVKVSTAADVSITKTASPSPATVGQPLTYTLTVRNAGPLPATNVTVTDVLQTGANFGSATANPGSCTFTAGTRTVSCALGSIAAGGTAIISLIVTPTQAGAYANTASVTATEDDLATTNNSASSSTTVNVAPTGTATPTPGPGTPGPGTPTPTLCAPRPKVGVTVTPNGPGRVHVTLQANNTSLGNALQKVTYGSASNATVITSSQTGTGGFTVTLPSGTQTYEFDVQRITAGQGATAPFVVTDACGDWQTFAGLGTAIP